MAELFRVLSRDRVRCRIGISAVVSIFASVKRIVMCNPNCARLSPQSDGRSSPLSRSIAIEVCSETIHGRSVTLNETLTKSDSISFALYRYGVFWLTDLKRSAEVYEQAFQRRASVRHSN